jgi:hypothetical protein
MSEMTAEVRRLIDRPNYAHVATLLPDGAPHVVPVWVDLEGDKIAILTGPGSPRTGRIVLIIQPDHAEAVTFG